MKPSVVIAFLLSAMAAEAQFFGLTPQQIQFLDARYWRVTNAFNAGLTTSTVFGALGNVYGTYETLTYTETDPVFGPWLTSFSATNTPGTTVTDDTTTITNNGSGQFSVKNYDTNAIAHTIYQRNARDSWNDYAESRINGTRWSEATNNGVLAVTWGQLTGP